MAQPLQMDRYQVEVPEDLRQRAKGSIDRMLEYVPVQELSIPALPELDVQLKEFDQLLGGILHD